MEAPDHEIFAELDRMYTRGSSAEKRLAGTALRDVVRTKFKDVKDERLAKLIEKYHRSQGNLKG